MAQAASEQEKNAEAVRRYLRVFATRDLADPGGHGAGR